MNAAGLVINPISGTCADARAAAKRIALAREAAREAGMPVEIVLTERAGHARELARAFRESGAPLVVSWGGDGTANEVASALVGSSIPIGLVPSGSGNGLATELGFSRDPRIALRHAFSGPTREIDAGDVNGRIFINIMGAGFDGHIAHQFQQLAPGRRGGLPYLKIGLRSVWAYRPAWYRLTADGESCEFRALLVAFANGRQYGNNAVIAPRAEPDDGALEVVVVEAWPAAKNFLRLHHLFRRTADRAPGVLTRSVREARLSSHGPMEMHVDGEVVEPSTEASVRVLRRAIRLRVPKG